MAPKSSSHSSTGKGDPLGWGCLTPFLTPAPLCFIPLLSSSLGVTGLPQYCSNTVTARPVHPKILLPFLSNLLLSSQLEEISWDRVGSWTGLGGSKLGTKR